LTQDENIFSESAHSNIRVLLTEYNHLNAKVLARMMQKSNTIHFVGNATSLAEINKYLYESAIDVILLNMSIPNLDFLNFISSVRLNYPRVKIIIYADSGNHFELIRNSIELGVVGYLPNDVDIFEIIDAIHIVFLGNKYYRNYPVMKSNIMVNNDKTGIIPSKWDQKSHE
jgi:DNA-binding NarL/FixJ family response regulator